MWILEAVVLALSLCADCFAVTACSSLSLRKVTWREALPIALVFSIIHISLLFLGWLLGDALAGYLHKIADVLGFLLLLYVGGSMIIDALRGEERHHNLNGFKNIVLGAVATSIDAFAVGISLSLCGTTLKVMAANVVALFIVTLLVVTVGVFGGSKIGDRFGKPAEIVGGIVLIAIGIGVLAGLI
ncbi:MAG: manganese efflux pump [Bacteroidales bacterium]|nr:manganese efflux pump [Bacteroidales bacterium]